MALKQNTKGVEELSSRFVFNREQIGANILPFEQAFDGTIRSGDLLSYKAPMLSAKFGLTRSQYITILSLSFTLIMAGTFMKWQVFYAIGYVICGFFLVQQGFLIWIFIAGNSDKAKSKKPQICDASLPILTILLPLYREAASVKGLMDSLMAFKYPLYKLDVIILLEEDDQTTAAALNALDHPLDYRIITLTDGDIKTKPRALNIGLANAYGDYITIFDAEDRPHPLQARKAIDQLCQVRNEIVCIQAPLQIRNATQSWLSAQFSAEYDNHFKGKLKGLVARHFAIPLGGTSNYFKTETLKKIMGWDAYNVTEDADLAVRLAATGCRFQSLAYPTYEEAPVKTMQWIGQRSRWLQGFIQTLAVMFRRPVRLIRDVGLKSMTGFVFMLLAPVLSALVFLPTIIWLAINVFLGGIQSQIWPLSVMISCYLVTAIANFHFGRSLYFNRLLLAATLPLYWALQFPAIILALFRLCRRPYYWKKTEHGLIKKPDNKPGF